jgi:hypothetical protein
VAAALPGIRQVSDLVSDWLSGWRGLARFWAGLLGLSAVISGVLQILGPPPVPVTAKGPAGQQSPLVAHLDPNSVPHPPAAQSAAAKTTAAAKPVAPPVRPGRNMPGPIADPDPAMLDPVASDPKLVLPRISIDGRPPMSAYAAGFDSSTLRPRVGVLLAGIGTTEADSMAAIKTLPGGITLAIAPYVTDISRLLGVARLNEHEYLLSLPMEPQGYPVNDPDDRVALMTSLAPAENLARLHAILGRITGYAGVTDALGSMHGERLAALPDQFDAVLEEVAARGLLFVDARAGQPRLPHVWSRAADIVLDDDPLNATSLDQRLDALTHLALDKGSALAVGSAPRPVTVERLAAWANTLASKGLALAPVSALVLPPAKPEREQ